MPQIPLMRYKHTTNGVESGGATPLLLVGHFHSL